VGDVDAATRDVVVNCSVIVAILAVTPWTYVRKAAVRRGEGRPLAMSRQDRPDMVAPRELRERRGAVLGRRGGVNRVTRSCGA
jgi:hypothetical protein